MNPSRTAPQRTVLTGYLQAMLRIRLFEEKVTELRKQQTIVGSIHLCIGQEAIYIGARAALGARPRVRDLPRPRRAWPAACPGRRLRRAAGREIGPCKGRGGSAQFSAADHGFFGENSIVGAGAAIALGAALSAKMEGRGRVVLTAFGEGAMNQGGVHEAMNFAAYQDLPLVFLCENNTYSELTPTFKMVRKGEMYQRADAYGMPGVRVDGNDPDAVRRCVSSFVDAARDGRGPALVEAMTQRLVGHYYGDMQSYRPKGELTEVKKTEPIVRARQALLELGATQAELDAIEAALREENEQAAQGALAAPLANVDQAQEHLYA